MTKEKVIQIIQTHLEEIRKFHVESLGIFGSVARDESTESGDDEARTRDLRRDRRKQPKRRIRYEEL